MLNNTSRKIDYLIEEAVIQNEINFFMQELQESSFKDMTDKSKKIITNVVKAFHDPKKIDKLISGEKAAQERRKKYLKKYDINVDSFTRDLKEGKDISIPLKMLLEELFNNFLDKKGGFTKNLMGTFITVIFVVILMIVFNSMKAFLPLGTALTLAHIIFAPIIEETMKRVSVKYNVSGFSFLWFNAIELKTNFEKLIPSDMNLPDLSLIGLARFIAILLHLVTWMMHIKGNLLDKYKTDFKIEDNQKDKYKNAASFQATLMHSLFNGLPDFLASSDATILATMAATTAGGLTVLEKTKAKKEFSKAVDKFLKPLRGQKIPKKITA